MRGFFHPLVKNVYGIFSHINFKFIPTIISPLINSIAKATIQRLKLNVISMFNDLNNTQNTRKYNQPQRDLNNFIIRLIQKQVSSNQIQQSNINLTVSGGTLILGVDIILKLLGTDTSYLLKATELMKNSYIIGIGSSYALGGITLRTLDGTTKTVKSLATTTSNLYSDTKALIEKGTRNILENVKTVPNIGKSQEFIKIDILKATTPETMKQQLLEALKEAEKPKILDTTIDPAKSLNMSPPSRPKGPTQILTATSPKLPSLSYESSIGGIQDIPMVRKPNYGDFITPPPLTSTDLKLPKLPKDKTSPWL